MKTMNKLIVALVTGAVLTSGASAAVNYSGDMGGAYVGAKGGIFKFDGKSDPIDNPKAYGAFAGYDFGSGLGVEGEYITSTEEEAKVEGVKLADMKVETMGAYATYRYNIANGLYAKGKLGYAKTTQKASNVAKGLEVDDVEQKGIAGGVGVGYNINDKFAVEGEYSRVGTKDKEHMDLISLGAYLKF